MVYMHVYYLNTREAWLTDILRVENTYIYWWDNSIINQPMLNKYIFRQAVRWETELLLVKVASVTGEAISIELFLHQHQSTSDHIYYFMYIKEWSQGCFKHSGEDLHVILPLITHSMCVCVYVCVCIGRLFHNKRLKSCYLKLYNLRDITLSVGSI